MTYPNSVKSLGDEMSLTPVTKVSIVAAGLGTILAFQNCSENVMSFSQASVQEKYGQIPCVSFDVDKNDCLTAKNGVIGNLYYLKSQLERDQTLIDVTDRFDKASKLTSAEYPDVESIISRGFKHDSYVLMPSIAMPTMNFSDGFSIGDGNVLKDMDGKVLIEAFALDLRGYLRLPSSFAPGFYQLGTISDDGSILEVATNGNENYDLIVNNDKWHSPTLKCSAKAVYLDHQSKLAMRLRYFQGPRTAIAMTMVMRKVSSESDFEADTINCNFSDGGQHKGLNESTRFFKGLVSDKNYAPDYKNGVYGFMMKNGWSAIPKDGFGLPDRVN